MKFRQLTAVAHNVADSLSSGQGFLIGHYRTDIWAEVVASAEGWMEVNFLTGEVTGAVASETLAGAVRLYAQALPDFCAKHGLDAAEVRALTARYSGQGVLAKFVVTVEDTNGRRSVDEYGWPMGTRLKRGVGPS
jgi:hypothetical protein